MDRPRDNFGESPGEFGATGFPACEGTCFTLLPIPRDSGRLNDVATRVQEFLEKFIVAGDSAFAFTQRES